jgi:sphinganine-1-phosphate aldolase
MSCLAHKYFYGEGRSKQRVIIPVTSHAAFDKAAHYFGLELVKIGLDLTGRVDLKQVERAINEDTVLLVGSAPNFPHGIVDDIEGLGRLAKKYGVGLHVDACLGSFLVPHMRQAGFNDLPPFDFSVEGVTAISCDTHKFGFAPKGSSVVLYRDSKLRHCQYFVSPEWTGGIYASPTMAGSRPGALVAACWAVMMYMGEPGYIKCTRKIITAAREIKAGVKALCKDVFPSDLELCYDPVAMVIAVKAKEGSPLNIYAVNDHLSSRGWNLNALQEPAAIHICCTMPTTQVAQMFVSDLQWAVTTVLDEYKKAKLAGKPMKPQGQAAIYGMASSVADKSLVGDLTCAYLDALTTVAQKDETQ